LHHSHSTLYRVQLKFAFRIRLLKIHKFWAKFWQIHSWCSILTLYQAPVPSLFWLVTTIHSEVDQSSYFLCSIPSGAFTSTLPFPISPQLVLRTVPQDSDCKTKSCLTTELRYVFRSHLQPSSRPRELYTKIHKHGLNHGIMTIIKVSELSRRVSSLLKWLNSVLLAVKMVKDVTETRNVIPSLEFKTWTIKSLISFYSITLFYKNNIRTRGSFLIKI